MSDNLKRTPLHALHLEQGARMVPFAGYDMPVQYPLGVMKEHLHTRAQAGLFDVSHMGQIRLSGQGVAQALEQLVPVDIADLPVGLQRYALFTNETGGILDDLMVARLAENELMLVVNAACKDADLAHLRARLGQHITIEPLFEARALLALQGPAAVTVLARLAPEVADMTFMQYRSLELADQPCYVSRSGYTGEDGYEISVPAQAAEAFARRLLAEPEVALIGLGARDSLRLEAGLCLYGHDMNTQTTPAEANLGWAISKVRRPGGARAGGFPGAETLGGPLKRKRVGLLPQERTPVREGCSVTDAAGEAIGEVCSGGFGPSLGGPLAMGYLAIEHCEPGTVVNALVRGKAVPMKVVSMPFVPARYYRGHA